MWHANARTEPDRMLLVFLTTVLCFAGSDFLTWADALEEPGKTELSAGYGFAADHFSRIATLVRERPGVVVPEEIGKSWDKTPIWAFHVARPADHELGDPSQPRILIFAGIHALEWISTEVAVATLEAMVAQVPPHTRLTVIPLLNPDGRAKVEQDLLAGERIYRRGNKRNVDLNRNFAVNREARAIWKAIIPGYYSTTKSVLSEPESRALDALVAKYRYSRSASLHAFGGYFYYPWSGLHTRPERADRNRFLATGRAMEQAQGSHAYRTRQLGRWGFFFRAHGTEIDHLYGEYGTEAWLVELTRSGLGPTTLKTYFRWYNPKNIDRHREKGLRAMRALVYAP